MSTLSKIQELPSQLITPENFQPYGQVIYASKDGKNFDQEDAQLNLQNGIPHFYIMRLQKNVVILN
jgi:hypothetical protein